MAKRKRCGRPVNGILVLDKPAGLSSNQALQQVKRLYYASKAGHTGSLDPLADGVLPICFGEGTKFSQYLLHADKAYNTTVMLGAKSNTEDADGDLEFVADASRLAEEIIVNAVESMSGERMQVPPMYSALKHNGQRLYQLAREGREVAREARAICVHRIDLLSIRRGVALPRGLKRVEWGEANQSDSESPAENVGCEIELSMTVSKGTYIRSLAAELGNLLGVGGYVKSLTRIKAGEFRLEDAVQLEQLELMKRDERFEAMDQLLYPIDRALPHIEDVVLDRDSCYYLQRGNPVQVPRAPTNGMVKLMSEVGEFIGVGEIDDNGLVAPRRLVVNTG